VGLVVYDEQCVAGGKWHVAGSIWHMAGGTQLMLAEIMISVNMVV